MCLIDLFNYINVVDINDLNTFKTIHFLYRLHFLWDLMDHSRIIIYCLLQTFGRSWQIELCFSHFPNSLMSL